MGKIIGIDLGTTNSCMAVMEGGEPVVIPNAEGARTTASVVAFAKNGERLVGQIAKRQAVTNHENTIASIKRDMGTDRKVNIEGKSYSPQEISAMILAKLKADAESYLGESVTQAVITVPAYFSDSQRQATKDAGKIAGLEVLRIINEPTAAALSYGLDKEDSQKILVYDLGGGTFDVSILEIGDGVVEVLATNGNTRLGGDDFDQRIMDWMVSEYKKENGIDLSADNAAMQRLKEAAEKVKIDLSGVMQANINLPFITMDATGPKHLDMNLSRAQFDKLTEDLVRATEGPTMNALRDAGLSTGEIDKVVLVGGSTRIPAVQDMVKKLTGKEPYKGINPDECVALGAAVQGGKLAGEAGLNDILLLDVTPLSLSIETVGGVATRLIERNSTIPTRYSKIFTTAMSFQTAVEIKVLQGECPKARDNKLIGKFRLKGIRRAPRGVPQIEVTFDIDANGILNVSAKDKGTGKEQKIRIEASSGLTEQEIQRMRDEAKANEAKDKEEKERIDKINAADSNIFATEKQLKEYGDKLPADKKSAIEGALAKLKEAHKNADVAAIDTAIAELNAAWQAASQDIYAQQQAQGAQPGADAGQSQSQANAGGASNGGDSSQPEDVEFEEVK